MYPLLVAARNLTFFLNYSISDTPIRSMALVYILYILAVNDEWNCLKNDLSIEASMSNVDRY